MIRAARILSALAAFALIAEGCESSVDPDARLTATISTTAARIDTIPIAAAGSVRYYPEMHVLEVDDHPQSSYLAASTSARIFHRAIMETSIPRYAGRIEQAVLVLTTASSAPPSDVSSRHIVSSYAADLAVSIEDYDRPGSYVATVDEHPDRSLLRIDITAAARRHSGGNLGLRIQLAADPRLAIDPYCRAGGAMGTNFTSPSERFSGRLEITIAE